MGNKNRIMRIIAPSMRLYFIFLIIFAIATVFFNKFLAAAEAAVILLLALYSAASMKKRRRDLIQYIDTLSHNMDIATKDTLLNFPLGMALFKVENTEILWSNENFLAMAGEREHFFEVSMKDIIPDFSMEWLLEGKNECPEYVQLKDRKYKVYGNLLRSESEKDEHNIMVSTYWVDVTEFAGIEEEFANSHPVTAILMIDNYDELTRSLSDTAKSSILSEIDVKIEEWTGQSGGFLCKYDRDRYVFIFEERYLKDFVDNKFAVLDSVRELHTQYGVNATLSIGVGKGGKDYAENFRFASLGIEMALSRGGDQAIIKNNFNFEFYGGRSSEMERRTKVKSRVMASALGELIRDASGIYIMGHKQADMDSVGAAVGICCIARKYGKKARIVIDLEKNVSETLIRRMRTLPEYENAFISPQDAILEMDGKSLLVIVDTNRPEQTESESLIVSCNKVAVIDHHRRAATYIENAIFNFHEPYASSTCELMAELLQYLVEQSDILRFEAEAMLTGIVLDTKNFTLRTGSRTFEAAAFLRRAGSDTTEVKKMLQSDFDSAVERYNILRSAKIYHSGIAIATAQGRLDRVIIAQAADELLNIEGVEASFVFCSDGEAVNISARSIGDVNVQMVLEKLGGGGNKSTAGAQVKNASEEEVYKQLQKAIDEYIKSRD